MGQEIRVSYCHPDILSYDGGTDASTLRKVMLGQIFSR